MVSKADRLGEDSTAEIASAEVQIISEDYGRELDAIDELRRLAMEIRRPDASYRTGT